MKCPNCGAECTTNICNLCGTKISIKNTNKKITFYNIYLNTIYYINVIFFPPAKVMAVLWTCVCMASIASSDLPFTQKIIVMLFGYLFYCGIADIIYASNKLRYVTYKIKILNKKLNRLNKLKDMMLKQEEINKTNIIPNNQINFLNFDNMEGHEFEYFCAEVLRKNGFINVEVTQGSGDHGIDVLAEKDDITYAIQCKCYSSNIGNAAVQQAHTGKSLYHRDVAVVMTNQYFTQQAQEEAMHLGVKLWDRDKLNEFIEKSKI